MLAPRNINNSNNERIQNSVVFSITNLIYVKPLID